MADIPISALKEIAEKYDLEQVIIVARKTGTDGRECVSTYGVNKEHCQVAADIGNYMKYKVMGWKK